MITTITTATVSTIASAGIAGPLALVGILVLLGLLIQKEFISESSNPRTQRIQKLLDLGIAPLLFAFLLLVVAKVLESL